ncbi:MAG TPA: hypothetical protein PKA64_24975, partial [Myxococcota bacterium]|nr:hypothetical protein [Myxococcota bacterium]
AGLPEGEAARLMADTILADHGLHRAAVSLDEVVDFRHRALALGEAAAWRRTLVHAIADYFDCVALYERQAEEAQIFGPEHMLPHVEYTFVVYLRQLRAAWRAHTDALRVEGVWERLSRRQQVDAREGFCVSFVVGVKDRLEADRVGERRSDPAGWSAMQEQRRSLDRWMRTAGVRWRSSWTGVGSVDPSGYQAGLAVDVDPALRSPKEQRKISDRSG